MIGIGLTLFPTGGGGGGGLLCKHSPPPQGTLSEISQDRFELLVFSDISKTKKQDR